MSDLRQRITELLQRQGASHIKETVEDLFQKRADPLFGPDTLEKSLLDFDLIVDGLTNPDAVELALWFRGYIHSSVVAELPQNELNSAKAFAEIAYRIGVLPDMIEDVYQLILIRDDTTTLTPDGQYLIDLTRVAWGFSPEEFKEYTDQVRQRYANLKETEYRLRRRQWLSQRLAVPKLYQTCYFQDKYEEVARQNLTAAVKSLGGVIRIDYSDIFGSTPQS